MRKPSVKTLKAKLDKVFSIWVRQRGMTDGNNVCVSCDKILPWQDLQCGHFYRRQYLGTRWDPRNCWPQCFACNVWRRGNYANFSRFMYDKHSKEVMEELHELHKNTVKLTASWLEELIARYS